MENCQVIDGGNWTYLFAGKGACSWVSKLEQYFRLRGVVEGGKMRAVVVALEVEALG